MRDRRRRALGGAGLVAALAFLAGVTMPTAASADTTTSATCSAPGGVTYRASLSVASSVYGDVGHLVALERRSGDTWQSLASSTWELRWNLVASEINDLAPPFHARRGPLAGLNEQIVATYLSPRVVAPDGSCTIYLVPFAEPLLSGPAVAVVGDSLLQSLRDPSYNATWLEGYVQGNLADPAMGEPRRAEVEGQGGRRWTPDPSKTGIDRADTFLLDELRGLRAKGLRGMVVALGTNDAGWAASGASDVDRRARLDTVLAQMDVVLQELRGYGICTVVVTPPDNLANYYNVASPWYYAGAAQAVSQWLRDRVRAEPGWLRLQDWAAVSRDHHTWSTDNWFQDDNIHLNLAGRLHYSQEVTMAGHTC
jgi:lysophospholipase L1-like esterase